MCRETKYPQSDLIGTNSTKSPTGVGITQHVRVLGPDHNSGLVMTPLDNNLAGLHQSDNTAAAAAAPPDHPFYCTVCPAAVPIF